jgi:hypothetical protein
MMVAAGVGAGCSYLVPKLLGAIVPVVVVGVEVVPHVPEEELREASGLGHGALHHSVPGGKGEVSGIDGPVD